MSPMGQEGRFAPASRSGVGGRAVAGHLRVDAWVDSPGIALIDLGSICLGEPGNRVDIAPGIVEIVPRLRVDFYLHRV